MNNPPDHEATSLGPIERRELALRSLVCEESLLRFLNGLPVRPLTKARIERGLREMGIVLQGEPGSNGFAR